MQTNIIQTIVPSRIDYANAFLEDCPPAHKQASA